MLETIFKLTVPCADDGLKFINLERVELIKEYLKESSFILYNESPLVLIYRHKDFDRGKPFILISAHIDSIYQQHHAHLENGLLIGTLDNAACNGIVVKMMLEDRIHPQALVAFTGNEEGEKIGAIQAIEFLQREGIYEHLEFVVVLDLTKEGYPDYACVVENLFRGKEKDNALLKFAGGDIKGYLRSVLEPSVPMFLAEAAEDESWLYDEYGLNCLSFCLPCQVVDGGMHSLSGVRISSWAIKEYADHLSSFISRIMEDLLRRAR